MNNKSLSSKRLKCVLLGEPSSGKTCLLHRFTRGVFPTDYISPFIDPIETSIILDEAIGLSIFDTEGGADDSLRRLSYLNTDFFLICFSVMDPSSLTKVRDRWIPEISHPQLPPVFFLVGTKTDLASLNAEAEGISESEGRLFASEVGASGYFHCSSFNGEQDRINQIFRDAVRFILDARIQEEEKAMECLVVKEENDVATQEQPSTSAPVSCPIASSSSSVTPVPSPTSVAITASGVQTPNISFPQASPSVYYPPLTYPSYHLPFNNCYLCASRQMYPQTFQHPYQQHLYHQQPYPFPFLAPYHGSFHSGYSRRHRHLNTIAFHPSIGYYLKQKNKNKKKKK